MKVSIEQNDDLSYDAFDADDHHKHRGNGDSMAEAIGDYVQRNATVLGFETVLSPGILSAMEERHRRMESRRQNRGMFIKDRQP